MRLVTTIIAVVLGLVVTAVLWCTLVLRTSLPAGSGTFAVAGLEAPVTIALDSLGVPLVRATSDHDLAFAQGWLHARDRRFQMELQRRSAAGRLAEVVGAGALPLDRRMRTFGFAAVAESAARMLSPEHRRRMEAYRDGVNAWDRAHPAPPEFLLLGIHAEPWRIEDSMLTTLLMFEQLEDAGNRESEVEEMDATLPPALVAFLLPESTPTDVVLDGSPPPAPPPTPGPADVDLRDASGHTARERGDAGERLAALDRWDGGELRGGSNGWALAPSRTATGGALLCGDPHLGLRVPVIWHRMRLEGAGLAITGITLPGVPSVVAGTNGDVAWSMTSVEPDAADLVRVEVVERDTTRYRVPGGDEAFGIRRESIGVKGKPAVEHVVRTTRWGPVIGPSARGGLLALQWSALDPWVCDMDLDRLDRSRSVAEFVARLDDYRGPPQNFMIADRTGHIGWHIAGSFPRRHGFDPRRPRDGADSAAAWVGRLGAAELPGVVDPPDGLLVTANQRTVGGAVLRDVVGANFAMPWRARRLHDVLAARHDWTPERAQALQNDLADPILDVTAAALDRALTPAACSVSDTLARVRRVLDGWTHRADTTSVAHAYLRHARVALQQALLDPLVAPCVARDSDFVYTGPLADEVARRLLFERPPHLLDPRYGSYDDLVRHAALVAARRVGREAKGVPFDRVAWGRINRAAIHHPIGDAIPALGRYLDQPAVQLAGGSGVVRVARPRFGASMRMVVDLVSPARSTFTMPGGQSGHFLSPHYGDQFPDWVAGRARRLDPGPPIATLRLVPRR